MAAPDPEKIFAQLLSTTRHLPKGFSAAESQQMTDVMFQSWSAIVQRSLENPAEWLQSVCGFYLDQYRLWLNMFSPAAQTGVTPARDDRRFSAPEWDTSPLHNYLKQSYLLSSRWLRERVADAGLDEGMQKKSDFYTRQFIDALSPANYAMTNPEVLKETLESKGQNLLQGLENLLQDMEKDRISMTDESAFELGKNLASTPGSVVFQNELMQLIQFRPLTAKVSDHPVLIVPPCINKYYVLDLSENNSYVRYCLEQGNNVFIISWRNPDESLGDKTWDDYLLEGTIPAVKAVRNITGAEKLHGVGWCIGGTMLATTLAVLAAKRRKPFASATFFTTLLDFSDPGELGVFIDEAQVKQQEHKLSEGGVLPGKQLATTFAMLRANDLIWNYVVNNYLKGKTPPPFDILYWNSDSTNMTAAMYTWYLRHMYLENKLVEPGGVELCGVPVDLARIDCPVYFLSAIEDHIAPWKTTFIATEHLKGPTEFVLAASGHIAGVLNPANKNKRHFWINGQPGQGADHWLETAETVPGSWWPHWTQWLKSHAGKDIPAPERLGNHDYPEIEAAPGAFVLARDK